MSEELYQCTARRLATADPDAVDADTAAAEAHGWFQETGFDYAPVLDDTNPVGYVGKTMVAEAADTKKVKRVMEEIKLQNIISSDTEFRDILTGLEDEFFYLLGGKNQVTGILTRADLNTSPARIHLFDRISLFERELRQLIEDVAPNWEDEVYLSDSTIEQIDYLYDQAQQANVELSKIHYAGFSALGKIVEHYEECWQALGYETDHKASSDLDKIRDLRNDVAHSNLILQTTSVEYNTEGRSIRDLIKIYDAITSCNELLTQDS